MATIKICLFCKKEKLMASDNEPLCNNCLPVAIQRAKEEFEKSLTDEQRQLRGKYLQLTALL